MTAFLIPCSKLQVYRLARQPYLPLPWKGGHCYPWEGHRCSECPLTYCNVICGTVVILISENETENRSLDSISIGKEIIHFSLSLHEAAFL